MSAHLAPAGSIPGAATTRRWKALGLLTGANLIVFASVTIMNIALPETGASLGLTASAEQWVVTFYSLSFGALILVGGRLADVIGLRRCLILGLSGSAAASLLAGLAPTAPVLLTARVLQGAGGALVAATAVSLLSVTFPDGRNRAHAFGVLGVVMGVGTAGSFVLGGALVAVASWRWCLLINAPLALLLAWGIHRTAPAGPRAPGARVDLLGATLGGVSLIALMIGFDRATTLGWTAPSVIALLAAAAAGLVAFAFALRRSAHPLIPPALLSVPSRVAAYVAAALVGVAMFAGMFILTSVLGKLQGLSPIQTGLAFLPFAIGAVGATWLLPALRARLQPSTVLALGLLFAALAVASFALLTPDSGYIKGILPAMLLLGAGGTVVMVTAGDVATAGAGADSGIAGSLVNSAQQIGAALGTALLTSIMTATANERLTAGSDPEAAATAGYAAAGLTGGAIVLIAAVAVYSIRRRNGK